MAARSKVGMYVSFCSGARLIKGTVAKRFAYFLLKKPCWKCCGNLVVNQGYLVKLSCQMLKFIIACNGSQPRSIFSLKQQPCVPFCWSNSSLVGTDPPCSDRSVWTSGLNVHVQMLLQQTRATWMLEPLSRGGCAAFLGYRVSILTIWGGLSVSPALLSPGFFC